MLGPITDKCNVRITDEMDMTPLKVSCWRGKCHRQAQSGIPSINIYTWWSSRRYGLGSHAPMVWNLSFWRSSWMPCCAPPRSSLCCHQRSSGNTPDRMLIAITDGYAWSERGNGFHVRVTENYFSWLDKNESAPVDQDNSLSNGLHATYPIIHREHRWWPAGRLYNMDLIFDPSMDK